VLDAAVRGFIDLGMRAAVAHDGGAVPVGGSFANDFWKRELDASMRSTMSALIFLS
jgi:hypothetical protein